MATADYGAVELLQSQSPPLRVATAHGETSKRTATKLETVAAELLIFDRLAREVVKSLTKGNR